MKGLGAVQEQVAEEFFGLMRIQRANLSSVELETKLAEQADAEDTHGVPPDAKRPRTKPRRGVWSIYGDARWDSFSIWTIIGWLVGLLCAYSAWRMHHVCTTLEFACQ